MHPEKDMSATIELVSHMNTLLKVFCDKSAKPIIDLTDGRLQELKLVRNYFEGWFSMEGAGPSNLPTRECMEDLKCSIDGFVELTNAMLPSRSVIPQLINSDVVENHFCMSRMLQGNNNNPSYSQYCSIQNSMLNIKRTGHVKNNAGSTPKPYNLTKGISLRGR